MEEQTIARVLTLREKILEILYAYGVLHETITAIDISYTTVFFEILVGVLRNFKI